MNARLAPSNTRAAAPRLVLCAALLALAGCAPREPAAAGGAPLRLASTAPNLTEIVFAVGAGERLVGRTDSCDYPPAASGVPITGGFGTPLLEPLLAARPTHVLESVLADPEFARRLEALGIPLVHVACSRLDDIPGAILSVGQLAGCQARAQAMSDEIRRGLAAARNAPYARSARPRCALLFAADSPITAGRNAFVAELLRLAGGDSVGDASDVDYYHISLEWLLGRDPDIVICLFETRADDPCALFEKQTGWRALAAVRDRRVYKVADLNTVCRPGPRVLEGLAELKRVLDLDARRPTPPGEGRRDRTP